MNSMGYLQQFGRSLMLPMIVIPAAAILLWLGQWPWDNWNFPHVSQVLTLAGNSIFTYLPYLFAVGVALGLTSNATSAAMAALVSYFLFTRITEYYVQSPIQIGVTGGILIGLMAAISYHRFKKIEFPEYIQFFGGPRFVPLFMCLATTLFSALFIFLGPYFVTGLEWLSEFLLGLGGFGTFVYGVLHRLLVPTGLHHVLNNIFWFQVGSYERYDGQRVFGDLPRFFAQDPEAGIYMAGLYPIMMFALPAIAFAIIHEAREDLQPKVKATFMTAALACFLTGVSEPIEFAFLFVAPVLFVVHAILSGLSMWIVYALDIHHGFSYSAGAIDFMINSHLAKNHWLILPVGIGFALVYYCLFRWAIRRFQIPTPGREDGSPLDDWAGDIPYRAPLILQALGGKNNIVELEACITRLRLTLVNERLVDTAALRHLGAAGIIHLGGGNVQVVFGTFSELIREEINKLMRKDLRQILFHSPVQGHMISLKEVPDKIFANKLVGDGVAFIPERGELVAPVEGEVVHVYPTRHAIGLRTKEGLEVLLHIGIDTSKLQGKGFEAMVKEGDQVQPGQLLIRFDLNYIRDNSKSLATPMVITNPDMVKSWNFAPFKPVKKGQASIMSVILRDEKEKDGGKANG
jgi:glucose-specific phosphotransferase system IIA component